MIDLKDAGYCPSLQEIKEYVQNPAFDKFCFEIISRYNISEKIEFSKCSMAFGWNIKFKKSGKGLCTIYPDKNCFTALVVIGRKEKALTEPLLASFSPEIQNLYSSTDEMNGQRWLMIDISDDNHIMKDTLSLIDIRRSAK